MAFFKEFKEFALKGNVMDMAVGVIIGGAFGKIVTSFVNDILMPPIGLLLGGKDFSELSVMLKPAVEATETTPAAEAVLWKWGAFVQTCIDFAIIAFCIFMFVKLINSLSRKRAKAETAAPASAPAPEPTAEEKLLTEIRDLLKEKR